MQRHLIVLLVLFDPIHCVFRSERLLCSNGATVNVAVSASSNQNASLRAAELGGRLPTSTEVREIIFSLGGPGSPVPQSGMDSSFRERFCPSWSEETPNSSKLLPM